MASWITTGALAEGAVTPDDAAFRDHAPIDGVAVCQASCRRRRGPRGIASCLAASADRPHALAYRAGGEEFALVLPDKDPAGAMRAATSVDHEAFRLALAVMIRGKVTVSVAVATWNPRARILAPGELYRLADKALCEAEAEGRNQTRGVDVARANDRVVASCADPSAPSPARRGLPDDQSTGALPGSPNVALPGSDVDSPQSQVDP